MQLSRLQGPSNLQVDNVGIQKPEGLRDSVEGGRVFWEIF